MPRRRLNYHHLYAFWAVAQERSLSRAAERLHLSPQTLCTQVKALERRLGKPLFRREGRGVALTETGRLVLGYAEKIFALGEELCERLDQEAVEQLRVGVVDFLPKMVAFRLLEPLIHRSLFLSCREGRTERLVADLATHRLDVVLSDRPLAGEPPLKAHSHLLGGCGVTFLACRTLALRYREGFPESLDGAPFLMVGSDATLRRQLEVWFDKHAIRPKPVAEFDDSALLKVFGQAGMGIFCVPSLVEEEVQRQYRVEVVGRTEELWEQFYAISLERRLRHPAVATLFEAARRVLSGGG